MSDGIIVKCKLTPKQGGKLLMEKYALKKRVKELEIVVKKLGDVSDVMHQEHYIIQPYLDIWQKHGKLIEECRGKDI